MTSRNLFLTHVALTVACLSVLSFPTQAQIYTYRDANGRLVLANTPEPQRTADVQASPPVRAAGSTAKESATTRDRKMMYDELIAEHARLNDVRPELVRAVVQVESAYNPYAISPKGAQGLMQLMPSTAHQLGVKNAFSPEENVRAGVAYLRQLLDKYDNDEKLALAAYNAGPNAVDKYGQTVPPYRETQNYVAQISQITGSAVERQPNSTIYKVIDIVNGQPRVRFTDRKPAGAYEVVGR